MKYYLPLFIAGVVLMQSCNIQTTYFTYQKDTTVSDIPTWCVVDFYPLTMTQVSLFKEIPTEFNHRLLDDVSPDELNDRFKQAIHLGMYGIDLLYCSMNSETVQAQNCLKNIFILSDKLQVSGYCDSLSLIRNVEDDRFVRVMLEYQDFFSSLCYDVNAKDVETLMFLGVLVEELYLASQLDSEDKLLHEIIASRKNLMDVLTTIIQHDEDYKQHELIRRILPDLLDLQAIYEEDINPMYKVEPSKEILDSILPLSKVRRIEIDIPERKVVQVREKIKKIRNIFVG